MTKGVLLILSILEGHGWKPIEGYKTIIEANLDTNKLSTKLFPLISSPKFNTEIVWETDKQTLRRYKINRIPIKLKCFSVDENNKHEFLGYVVLPLSSAVEGVVADAKWYKLLGTSNSKQQYPPSILLQLNLESMNGNCQNQVSGRQIPPPIKNVDQVNKMAFCGTEKVSNRYPPLSNGHSHPELRVNGNRPNPNDPLCIPIENGNHENNNEESADDGDSVERMDDDHSDEEIDLYDIDEEDEEDVQLSDDCETDIEPTSPSAYNKDRSPDYTNDDSHTSRDNGYDSRRAKDSDNKIGLNGQTINENKRSRSDKPAENFDGCDKKQFVDQGFSHNQRLIQNRDQMRQFLRSSSQTSLATTSSHQTSNKAEEYLSNFPIKLLGDANIVSSNRNQNESSSSAISQYAKKILETDTSKSLISVISEKQKYATNSNAEHNNKQSPMSIFNPNKFNVNKSIERNTNNSNQTQTSLLLSNLFKKSENSPNLPPETLEFSSSKPSTSKKSVEIDSDIPIKPVLEYEKGYFRLSPTSGENVPEEEFELSIMIIYARHLGQMVTDNQHSVSPYRFSYQLFGYPINSEPFSNLESPEFSTEKASARIRSDGQTLAKYFSQNYILPVYFNDSNDDNIGAAALNLSNFTNILTRFKLSIKDTCEIHPIIAAPASDKNNQQEETQSSKPLIAISAKLKKTLDHLSLRKSETDNLSQTSNLSTILSNTDRHKLFQDSPFDNTKEEFINMDSSDGEISDSDPHDFREGDDAFAESRRFLIAKRRSVDRNRSKRRYMSRSCLDDFESKKEMMLHNAAFEIEKWKKQQQRAFLKELSDKISLELASQTKMMEDEWKNRLSECDKLEQNLKEAQRQVSAKERKLQYKERNLQKREEELSEERNQRIPATATSATNSSPQTDFHRMMPADKTRNEMLQKEVDRLQVSVETSEGIIKSMHSEIFELRKKLISSDNVISACEIKAEYERKMEYLQERKQYYKSQWLTAINDLHKFHSIHKKSIEEITSNSGGADRASGSRPAGSPSASIGIRLQKLTDERKTLMKTGLYSSNHSMIKAIDTKIQELLN